MAARSFHPMALRSLAARWPPAGALSTVIPIHGENRATIPAKCVTPYPVTTSAIPIEWHEHCSRFPPPCKTPEPLQNAKLHPLCNRLHKQPPARIHSPTAHNYARARISIRPLRGLSKKPPPAEWSRPPIGAPPHQIAPLKFAPFLRSSQMDRILPKSNGRRWSRLRVVFDSRATPY